MPIAVIEKPRSCSTNIAQPAGSFGTEEEYSSGNTITSRRSFDTSIPQNESIFVSLPCSCGLAPSQLFGYGSDWSAKLIRGLGSEAPAGFRSRRGDGHDRTPAASQNAAFPTYKAARVHDAARWRGGRVAARGAGAAARQAADHRNSWARPLRWRGANGPLLLCSGCANS